MSLASRAFAPPDITWKTYFRQTIACRLAGFRRRRTLRQMAALSGHLQADIGFVSPYPPPPKDARTFDHGGGGAYW